MAYDYMTRVSLSRPVTAKEAARRLDVHKPVAEEAADAYTVFDMNGTYLEVCDASYFQLGWGLLAFIVGFPGLATVLVTSIFWVLFPEPSIVRSGDQGWFSAAMLALGAICLAGCAVCIVLLRKDCFNYRHKSVRFNRKTRMVYAFRHNGPGGVVQVPWDKAFFYVHRQDSNSAMGGAPTVARCLVLDEGERVRDTFSFGLRAVNGASEASDYGRQVLYQVQANFEFIRRYMEDGPAGLPPVKEYLRRETSLKNSMRVWFHGLREVGRECAGLRIFALLVSGPVFVLAFLHYIAQLTSRNPVWPADVEAACGNNESPVVLARA